MKQDLTTSEIARKNILNNDYAIEHIEKDLELGGLQFKGETVFTKTQVADILDVDIRTVERYIKKADKELKDSGYKVFTGKALRELVSHYGTDTNVGTVASASVLGIFTFRAVLNLAMLVAESSRAKLIRSKILDIVMDVVAQKSGGHTKYINQRDVDFLPAMLGEDSYRRKFTDTLKDCLEMGNIKYAVYTDKIYKLVFLENAKEYKQILKLSKSDKTRDTMYAEVLNAIASVENGLADEIQQKFKQLGRKLIPRELDELISNTANNPYLKPIIDNARQKMASRDLGFRDALHQRLEHYIKEVPKEDFQRFLGERSQSLAQQLSDPNLLDVLKRLKDR